MVTGFSGAEHLWFLELLFLIVVFAEYVVFHELTHFLYPNHGKEFYQFIEKHMPDYRQREKQLRQVVIGSLF